jgi:DNA polymerase-3 subunit epsilon
MASVPVPVAPESRPPYAVVDVETNGLSWRRDRIVQVAVVTVTAEGTVVDRWASVVRPRWVRPGPRHLHGLDRRTLRRAPPFAAVAPELARRLRGAVFVAHNARFDWEFVTRALRRAGYPPLGGAPLCTMLLSRGVAPEAPSHRLVDVCARHGITIARAHDALADAEATAAVLGSLVAAAGGTEAAAAMGTRRGRPRRRRWWRPHRGASSP